MGSYIVSGIKSELKKELPEVKEKLEHEIEEKMKMQKLMEIRQNKMQRDIGISMEMAKTRERTWWFVGVYSLLLTAVTARFIKLRKFEPPPTTAAPLIVLPIITAYQADFAYGSKANRIREMQKKILEEDGHWFNEPLDPFPEPLKDTYRKWYLNECAENSKRGLPPPKHFAKVDL